MGGFRLWSWPLGKGDWQAQNFADRGGYSGYFTDPYALARATGERLLFKGNDFVHTDVAAALG